METKINLSEAQGLALEKLRALVGNEQVDLILAQGPDVIRARLDAFMQFESTHWAITRPFGIGYAYSIRPRT